MTGITFCSQAISALAINRCFATIFLWKDDGDRLPLLPVSNAADRYQHVYLLRAVAEQSLYNSPCLVISGF